MKTLSVSWVPHMLTTECCDVCVNVLCCFRSETRTSLDRIVSQKVT